MISPLRKPNQEASNTTGSIGDPFAAFKNVLAPLRYRNLLHDGFS